MSSLDFIRSTVVADLASKKHAGRLCTRFPPEPNGYLHIGHAKSICLNFGLAEEYNGACHMRFDDTNPVTEEQEYIASILEDIRWLGFDWQEKLFFASDYFPKLYAFAIRLIKDNKAYVDNLSIEQIREYRGTLTAPGQESPSRNKSISENLALFEKMRSGQFAEGDYVLRAKIDMAAANMNLRDPVFYRILHTKHHRTNDSWYIYPTYDYAHCLSDAIENITHSLCTLEFEDHRPLYDWFINQFPELPHPQQIEFARLNLSHTLTSKRSLNELVKAGYVGGWDDPRMPTLCGLRKRGYPASAIRDFCQRIGITKNESLIDIKLLESCVRNTLNKKCHRALAVLRPLKIVIENYPEDKLEYIQANYHPQNPEQGKRSIPFSREIYIDRDDFMEIPSKKFFRLAPGREVRLRYAYCISCEEVIKDADTGEILELRCTYDPKTLGATPIGRKVKSVLHWVCKPKAIPCRVNLYEHLFSHPEPGRLENWQQYINKDSKKTLSSAFVEPALLDADIGDRFQFERLGYFCLDNKIPKQALTFNHIVSLREDSGK